MPALPHIAQVFDVSVNVAQLTAVAWMIGALLPQLILGPVSDFYGRKPIIMWGGLFYVLTSMACAIAPNIYVVLAARLLQGMAMPTMFIAGYAAVNEWFDSQEAIKILARMNSVTILAPAFGPTIGGAFLLYFNWRWIFVILGIFALIPLILLYYKMPETRPTSVNKHEGMHLATILSDYKSVLFNKKFFMLSIVCFFPLIGLIAWMLGGPFVIVNRFKFTTLDFGLLQGVIFTGFIIGTKIVSKVATKENNNYFINIGILLSLFGAATASLLDWLYPDQLKFMIICMTLATFGSGMAMPILSRIVLDASSKPMGIKVTVFSIARVFWSGVLASVCVALFFNGTMLSIALLMLVFSLIAYLVWLCCGK